MANANVKQLEKMRIEKLRSLNDDEIKEYIAVILTDLMKLKDVDTVTALDDPNILNDDLEDLESKLDEINNILSEKYRFNDILKTMNYNFESTSHVGTKIKYTANTLKLKISIANALFIDIIHNYQFLNEMLDLFYILMIHQLELDNAVSSAADKPGDDVVSGINTIKINVIDGFKFRIADLVENIDNSIAYADKLFYSDERLETDIADMKEMILAINDSSDEKDVLVKRLGVLDAVIRLYDTYIEMQEFKETYSNVVSGIHDLIESDNAFLVYSNERYYDLDGAASFDEYMKKEPKFNIKKSELILP